MLGGGRDIGNVILGLCLNFSFTISLSTLNPLRQEKKTRVKGRDRMDLENNCFIFFLPLPNTSKK